MQPIGAGNSANPTGGPTVVKAVKVEIDLENRDGGETVQVLGRRRATATAGAWERFAGTEQVVVGNLEALIDGADVKVE